jgi:hypothetical protein
MVGSVSVAKIPALWRKNIYQTRDTTPQRSLFHQLISNPLILRDTAIAYYVKHLNGTKDIPPPHENYEDYRHFKGLI